jgi:hypothetical protein
MRVASLANVILSSPSQNFMISNYQGQEAIDNDDGSAYYNTHHNFLIYSGNGMKNDFGEEDEKEEEKEDSAASAPCLAFNTR